MRYFVQGSDGSEYGPAETLVLQQWIDEGRLSSATMVRPEAGGPALVASLVPGLRFAVVPPTQYAQPPQPGAPMAYTPPVRKVSDSDGMKEAMIGIGCAIGSVAATYFVGFLGIFLLMSGFGSSWYIKELRPGLAYLGIAMNVAAGAFWIYWKFMHVRAY